MRRIEPHDFQQSPTRSGRPCLSARSIVDAACFALATPLRLTRQLFDQLDESRARGLRQELGRKRWVVSWYRGGDRLWHARISGPGLKHTLVRGGPTRFHAIVRASAAMRRILWLRARIGPNPDRDPDSLLGARDDSSR